MKTQGIHHISSIVGHAQRDLDFNAGILGLRLVKQTLNYDDKNTFHFYYGNDQANSGLTTTFPIQHADDGRMGGGQVSRIQYAIKPGQTDFWAGHLQQYKIQTEVADIMGEPTLNFKDPAGLHMGMLETDQGPANNWSFAGISGERAITGVHAATLLSQDPASSLQLLTEVMGYAVEAEDEAYYKLKIHDDLGGILYLQKKAEPRGYIGRGSVHHIAFRIKDKEIDAWLERLHATGMRPTEIKERHYFRSIYMREKGGILFEFATAGPGMFIDEEQEHAGETFIVPEHFIAEEEEIRSYMMPLFVREVEDLNSQSYGYRNRYEYDLLQERKERLKQ